MFVGQADGQLVAFDLFSKDKSRLSVRNSLDEKSFNLNKTGITHLFQIKLNHVSKKQPSPAGYFLVAARLNGFLELIKFNTKKEEKFSFYNLLDAIRVHETALTNIAYSEEGSYILTTSQDCLVKIIKVNKSSSMSALPSNLDEREKEELSLMFVLNDHAETMITSMCIDAQNALNAATGAQNGTICVWNLFTGQCKFKFENTNGKQSKKFTTSRHCSPILKLELVQHILISLNGEEQMCLWNTLDGTLVKEFKLFVPVTNIVNAMENSLECGEFNIFSDCIVKSRESSIFGMVFTNFSNFLKSFFTMHAKIPQTSSDELAFKPPPIMCLYSRYVLITGGFSCIFLWNIATGELFKKINIKTNALNKKTSDLTSRGVKYTQLNLVKKIKVIQQKKIDSGLNLYASSTQTAANKNMNKLLLVMDYTDSIYLIKIPANITQNLS